MVRYIVRGTALKKVRKELSLKDLSGCVPSTDSGTTNGVVSINGLVTSLGNKTLIWDLLLLLRGEATWVTVGIHWKRLFNTE